MFYSVGDMEKGLNQIRKCLHSDPENKACSKLYRREKQIDKTMKQVTALKEKRQFNSAVKLLVGTGEDTGLLQDVKEEISLGKDAGHIHKNSPDDLYGSLVEMTCELYTEVTPLFLDTHQRRLTPLDEQQEEGSTILYRSFEN